MNPDHKNNYMPESPIVELDYLKEIQEQRNALKYTLRQIIEMLPSNRDWLDPDIESLARALIK